MVTDARIARARARTRELIDRVDASLARPRPTGELWERPEPPQEPTPAPRAPRQTPTPAASREFVRRETDALRDAMERAVAKFVSGQRRLLEMRCTEAERRLAETERRLAALEKERER